MVVVGYYHLFTRRQASNKAEESYLNFYFKILSSYAFLFPPYSVGKCLRRKNRSP